MDEAEKYQQRLQAIAEKRRLQEEEDRAKREIEDQKLRDQQLKRKSLRDQWLMEGPPTTPDSPGPNSPFFSSPTEEIEAQIDKLQESQQMAEEKGDLQEDNDKAEEVNKDGGSPEETPTAGLENGQQEPSELDAAATTAMSASPASPEHVVDSGKAVLDNGLKSLQVTGEAEVQPIIDTGVGSDTGTAPEEAAVIPNGTQEGKEETGADFAIAPPQQEEVNTDAPQSATETPGQEEGPVEEGGTEAKLGEDPAPLPPSSEAEPGKDLEDEDAGEIIRAERVIVTDEGDEPADAENVAPQDDTKEPAPPPESSAAVGVPVPEVPKPEKEVPKDEAAEPGAETQTGAEGNVEESPVSKVEPPAEGNVEEAPVSKVEPPAEGNMEEAPVSEVEPPAEGNVEEAPASKVEPPAEGNVEAAPASEVEPPAEGNVEAAPASEVEPPAEGNVEEAPASELEPPADSGETDLSVPVYPTELPSLVPQPEAEGEGVKPEEKENAPAPAVTAGQFQDIPLDGNAKPGAAKESELKPVTGTTEAPAEPSEQQALLDPSKVTPSRAEGGETPKRKTCQCCSVM
ncbi:hypothetical protein SKAU_G00122510 [Synaphobranchus kaupii]|uniref:Paralemmin-3 n=1 Tax=Synaphobranchus kaupii TaxID=118154 RepID=A0A9Q1FPG3_SYNKA|nr:hypothetical protein SKAU_G00122510 [Synaphobranchus kaupii]